MFNENAQANAVYLYSEDLQQKVAAPNLSEEDVFNSHPLLGTIAYRLPAVTDLFGLPSEYFD
jgi:hypothetical protein